MTLGLFKKKSSFSVKSLFLYFSECRSVIVAGGTMQPMSEFRDQLFVSAGASLSQITEFSCGHVIPLENILPIVCTKDFLGNTFDFSYTKRNTTAMVNFSM